MQDMNCFRGRSIGFEFIQRFAGYALFSWAEHRNRIYSTLSMPDIHCFRGRSIGFEFIQRFRCRICAVFVGGASGLNLFNTFDAENELFTRTKHRNELYLNFSMLKIVQIGKNSIGIDCKSVFRCISPILRNEKTSDIIAGEKFDASIHKSRWE